jgi:prepilin-type N-terminal cleavage/methylation domain-containing protein/prepilin-type processing-associated H-X9-DG protein
MKVYFRVCHRHGFTLIELLIVIAIISILAGIMFPTFARAREMARRSSCASNFKQISMGIIQYAQDYDDSLPLFSLSGQGYKGVDGYNGADGARWADSIFPYIKSTQVFDCPSGDRNVKVYSGGRYFDPMTYSYGIVTASVAGNIGVAGRNLSEIEDTARTLALVEDGRQDSGSDGEGQCRLMPSVGESLATLAGRLNGFRHTGVGENDIQNHAFNAAYADGHVKWVRLTNTWNNGEMQQWTINAE